VKAKGAKVEKVKKAKPVKTVKAVKAVKAMKAVKTARPGQDINITPTGSHIIPAEPACMLQMPLRCAVVFSQKHLRCLGSRLVYFPATGGRQKSRTSRKEGRQEGKGEGRKEERKEERKEGRKARARTERGNSLEIAWGHLRWRERDGSAGRAWMDCEAWYSLGELRLRERGRSAGPAWMDCDSMEIVWVTAWKWFGSPAGGSETGAPEPVKRGNSLGTALHAGGSETEAPGKRSLGGAMLEGARRERAPDECGWIVRRGNSLRGAPVEGARRERRTSAHGL